MKKFFGIVCLICIVSIGIYMVVVKAEMIQREIYEMPLANWEEKIKQNLDTSYQRVAVGERKTNEDQYRKIEQQLLTDQAYLKDLEDKFIKVHDDFQAHDFLDKNIMNDGPMFYSTFFYLQNSEVTYSEIKDKVTLYLSEEQIHQRALDLHIEEEFMNVYKDYIATYFSYLSESFVSNLPQQKNALYNIFTYLKNHKDVWAIYEKGILFDDQAYVDGYQELLNEFQNIQQVRAYE